MTVKRREIPEALAWFGGALAFLVGVGFGWRAVARKVKAHNAEVIARREAWRNR